MVQSMLPHRLKLNLVDSSQAEIKHVAKPIY